MTTVSRSQVATARDAGYGLAVGRQVFRSHLIVSDDFVWENNVVRQLTKLIEY